MAYGGSTHVGWLVLLTALAYNLKNCSRIVPGGRNGGRSSCRYPACQPQTRRERKQPEAALGVLQQPRPFSKPTARVVFSYQYFLFLL